MKKCILSTRMIHMEQRDWRAAGPKRLPVFSGTCSRIMGELGLGVTDGQDSEQSRTLEPREIDRNAYCRPTVRQVSPHEMRSRRKPGWIDCRFVLPRPIWLTPLCRLGSNQQYPNASWPLRRPIMKSL